MDDKGLKIDGNHAWLHDFARDYGGSHLIAFSRGKDAIASLIACRESGLHVIPFHMHLVPGLEFVAESLAYFERVFDCKILDIPHPSLLRMLKYCVFQPPQHVELVDAQRIHVPTFAACYADARKLTSAPAGCLVASGVRACDSIVRRLGFKRFGHIRPKTETFYPVWNYNIAMTRAIIAAHGISLPVDYELFGRSFDGIDARFLVPLARHRPADYRRVLEVFPLAELEVFRHGIS